MVPVYDSDYENIIGEVRHNTTLDYRDGNNYTCGSTGRHKGLTQLEDGRYVLIHSTQWQGERDSAEIISAYEAMQEIMKSGNTELFDQFPDLQEERDKNIFREKSAVVKDNAPE